MQKSWAFVLRELLKKPDLTVEDWSSFAASGLCLAISALEKSRIQRRQAGHKLHNMSFWSAYIYVRLYADM